MCVCAFFLAETITLLKSTTETATFVCCIMILSRKCQENGIPKDQGFQRADTAVISSRPVPFPNSSGGRCGVSAAGSMGAKVGALAAFGVNLVQPMILQYSPANEDISVHGPLESCWWVVDNQGVASNCRKPSVYVWWGFFPPTRSNQMEMCTVYYIYII